MRVVPGIGDFILLGLIIYYFLNFIEYLDFIEVVR